MIEAQGGASAARGTPGRSHVQTQLPVPFAAADCYRNAAGSPAMAGAMEVVGLRASPAEVSREPGESWHAQGSSLGPAMYVGSHPLSCCLTWDSSSRMIFSLQIMCV